VATAKPVKSSPFKKIAEWLFNNQPGNAFDNMLMRITSKRWRKKMQLKKRNNRGIIMAMDAGKHYAKPDPINFQAKLIVSYQNKVTQVMERCADSVAH